METKPKRTTFQPEPEVIDRIRRLAVIDKRSLGKEIDFLLQYGLDCYLRDNPVLKQRLDSSRIQSE